jgi:ABC-2 type transport system ATP-binding protein
LNELRHLTRTSLLIETKQPISSLNDIKGVHDLKRKDQALSFQVDTKELDHVIKYVSQFGIVRLESAPPTLEDLFMSHYDGGSEQSTNTGVGGER